MNNLDVNNLLNALENEGNASIINMTSRKIKEIKNNILQRLQMERSQLKIFHKKLKHYRYCSDMSDLQFGYYVRWIPLKNPDKLYLTNGGLLLDVDIINNCVQLKVKNNRNRIFQIKFDECEIFQKISNQERVILGVLDFIDK